MLRDIPFRAFVVRLFAGFFVMAFASLAAPAHAQQVAAPAPAPSPEMQRLSRLIAGDFTVVEKHHARPGSAEWLARGTASYVPGPDGCSIVEDYRSNGPRGAFRAVAVLWWDPQAAAFRHFECESGEPCAVVEDKGVWQGQAVVFTRSIERQGKKIALEERYDFAREGQLIVTASYSVDGGPPVTGMTITYTRTSRAQ